MIPQYTRAQKASRSVTSVQGLSRTCLSILQTEHSLWAIAVHGKRFRTLATVLETAYKGRSGPRVGQSGRGRDETDVLDVS